MNIAAVPTALLLAALAALGACDRASSPPPLASSEDTRPLEERVAEGKRPLGPGSEVASDVAREAVQRYPSTFAGAWSDEAGTVHVAFTSDLTGKVAELAAAFPDTLIIGVPARFTLDELRVAAEEAEDRLAEMSGHVTFVSIDLDDNRVVVALAPSVSAEDRAEVEAAVASDAVVVQVFADPRGDDGA